MIQLGLPNNGQFDQASIPGTDFGEDYTQDYGINPTNLKGKYMEFENSQYDADFSQRNIEDADEMSSESMGNSPDFGNVPQGMYGVPPQMGAPQMGSLMDTLKNPLFSLAGFSVTPLHLALIAAAGGAYWYFKMRK